MKKNITNCLATTGLSLILLALVAILYNASLLCIETILQIAGANILIHAGLNLLKFFESRYFLVEILLETGYVLAVLFIFGAIFGWYSSTPPWVLILMGISVYFIGGLIDIFQVNKDIKIINRQLKNRRIISGEAKAYERGGE